MTTLKPKVVLIDMDGVVYPIHEHFIYVWKRDHRDKKQVSYSNTKQYWIGDNYPTEHRDLIISIIRSNGFHKNAKPMPFLGPNCYGFINYLDKVSVWSDQIAGDPVKRGVGLICQSGTIGNTISFNHRSLPIAYIMSLGNQINITIEDSIAYLLNDHRVTAIGIYAESFNNPQLLIKVFEKAKNKKIPIAIVKVGRSKIATRTIFSHTGSLSGKEDIYDSLFKNFGVAKCYTLSELCETLKIFHTLGSLKENKISIMGPSGGDMAMIGDVSEKLSINYPAIPNKNIK